MAHVYEHGRYTHHRHVHLISLLLLAAVVLFVMLTVPRHKPLPTEYSAPVPAGAPR
jgi:hypothetical protein